MEEISTQRNEACDAISGRKESPRRSGTDGGSEVKLNFTRFAFEVCLVVAAGGLGFLWGSISEFFRWRDGKYPTESYEYAIAQRKWRDAEPKREAQ